MLWAFPTMNSNFFKRNCRDPSSWGTGLIQDWSVKLNIWLSHPCTSPYNWYNWKQRTCSRQQRNKESKTENIKNPCGRHVESGTSTEIYIVLIDLYHHDLRTVEREKSIVTIVLPVHWRKNHFNIGLRKNKETIEKFMFNITYQLQWKNIYF